MFIRPPFLAITLLSFLAGCYPIERVYERTQGLAGGQQIIESFSKIKIDEDTKKGVFVRTVDSPDLKCDGIPKDCFYTDKRSKSTEIGKLENCLYIDRSNWSCRYEELWELEMVDGNLRWKTGASNVPYEVTYRLSF